MHRNKDGGRLYVGVDIGNDRLDMAATGLRLSVKNNRQGWQEALRKIRRLKRHVHFVCEPIGHYGGAFIQFLHTEGKVVSVVHGLRVRNFARATGRSAKTDKIDAQTLAELGRKLGPAPTAGLKRPQLEIRALMRCHFHIKRSLVQQTRYQATADHPRVKRVMAEILKPMRAQCKVLDRLSQQAIDKDASLRKKFESFYGVVGVGKHTAKALIAELPELGSLNRREVASLAGLAPFNKDSGSCSAPRHIKAGRGRVRIALFMAAGTAARINPVLAPVYKRLRARGKKHRVALVAVMRKLLIHLNSLASKVEAQRTETAPVSRRPKTKQVIPARLVCLRKARSARGGPANSRSTSVQELGRRLRAGSLRCSVRRPS